MKHDRIGPWILFGIVALAFATDGQLKIPPLGSWRTWPFVGTPVTPNDMNKGKAAFPEFHHVYMDPESYKSYRRTGVFPEGTVLAKELTTVGKKKASSGRAREGRPAS